MRPETIQNLEKDFVPKIKKSSECMLPGTIYSYLYCTIYNTIYVQYNMLYGRIYVYGVFIIKFFLLTASVLFKILFLENNTTKKMQPK